MGRKNKDTKAEKAFSKNDFFDGAKAKHSAKNSSSSNAPILDTQENENKKNTLSPKKKLLFISIALIFTTLILLGGTEIVFRLLNSKLTLSSEKKESTKATTKNPIDTIDDEKLISEKKDQPQPNLYGTRPVALNRELGMIFKPHQKVIKGDGVDFSVEEKTNSFGFLDYERQIQKPEGRFRILFVGDSFVEAEQVEISKKSHVVLEKMIKNHFPNKDVECMALGFSGMGTTNELLFYSNLGHFFKPDLVVLVFVANDFANNSPTLQGINEGWHPKHMPRFFYEINHINGGQLEVLQPDMEFYRYLLPAQQPKTIIKDIQEENRWWSDNFFSWSSAYAYVKNTLSYNERRKRQMKRAANIYSARKDYLSNDPFYAQKLKDWRYPDDADMQSMFSSANMPQVFEEAVTLTEAGLSQFKSFTQKDGTELLVLIEAGVSRTPDSEFGRKMAPNGMLQRLVHILESYKINYLNLKPAFEKSAKTTDLSSFYYRYDGHWNPKGHETVAHAVYDWINENELLQSKPSP